MSTVLDHALPKSDAGTVTAVLEQVAASACCRCRSMTAVWRPTTEQSAKAVTGVMGVIERAEQHSCMIV
jgi:hypothetical protein